MDLMAGFTFHSSSKQHTRDQVYLHGPATSQRANPSMPIGGRLLRKKPVLDLCMMVMMIVNLWEEPSTNRDTTNDSLYLAIFERPHWLLVIPKWKGPLSQLLMSVANLADFAWCTYLHYTIHFEDCQKGNSQCFQNLDWVTNNTASWYWLQRLLLQGPWKLKAILTNPHKASQNPSSPHPSLVALVDILDTCSCEMGCMTWHSH